MSETMFSIVRKAYQAYIDKDRAVAESLFAEDFRFTSPRDNHIDRGVFFNRCWSNVHAITGFNFIHLVSDGDCVIVTYEGQRTGGNHFRNTEILTIRNGKIVDVEVYFGWSLPHAAPAGGFID